MEKCNKDCENCRYLEQETSVCTWFLANLIYWNFETKELKVNQDWFNILF